MEGLLIDKESSERWEKMKFNKISDNYMIFNVDSNRMIVVKESGTLSYDDFLLRLSDNHCSFAVVQLPESNKLALIMWTPKHSTTREKMIYATASLDLSSVLGGFAKIIQASCSADVSLDSVKKSLGIRT